MHQAELTIETRGRDTLDITGRISREVTASGVETGLCHIFLKHTSASLLINENADADVQRDLETFFADLVPDGDPRFRHRAEGADDMAAHVRLALTHSDLTVPVSNGRLALGTWQGIFLWEHRYEPHHRHIVVTIR
ncbi:secondary thiamine-phosphate synthase enzyme YjbQ [Wenzhouxiangella sediminis]|uniref:YjbQ family protein n=1 Tax=Wenzhouxiangella sediminis TaxID=1792836 RepID=A0A3E1KDC3_9GAMM|nr:secondary thiamine-phosphate synthase enzyme YjbQ [Wenzhouxiangella sediminis]RFF32325.1 YjbQ family protein [Wenzhouxiangella sediminis]